MAGLPSPHRGASHEACIQHNPRPHLVFPLSQQQEHKIKKLVWYIIHLYGRYFLSVPLDTAAVRHDLAFGYDLVRYEHFELMLARAARTSIRRHLWYLTPELVVLCLFDNHLPEEEKQIMAAALHQVNRPALFATGKPGQSNFNPVAAHLGPQTPFVIICHWEVLAAVRVAWGEWTWLARSTSIDLDQSSLLPEPA